MAATAGVLVLAAAVIGGLSAAGRVSPALRRELWLRLGSWAVLLPLMLVSGLLALLGLDYAWPRGALIVSPLLYVVPQLIVWALSQRSLFAVALPWSPSAPVWLGLHALAALVGTAGALAIRRPAAAPLYSDRLWT